MPQDYVTIQAAIDSSADGDTVLVSEGIYFENIRYRGKAITVASLYLVDGDTTHIDRTIIDGSRSTDQDSGSVVYFVSGEDTTSVLCGFTITGGTGTRYYNNLVTGIPGWVRAGGGIFSDSAGARIVRNNVTRNRVMGVASLGGGLEHFGTRTFVPFVIVEGNRVTDNYVRGTASNCWACSGGADFAGVDVRVVQNVFERDTAEGTSGAAGGGVSFWIYDLDTTVPGGFLRLPEEPDNGSLGVARIRFDLRVMIVGHGQVRIERKCAAKRPLRQFAMV